MRLTIRNSDGTVSQPMNLDWSAALEKLAAYEDAEEQGRLVPVVLCGECKHWKRIRNACFLASCELDALVRSEDFFCADGERKDGDGE